MSNKRFMISGTESGCGKTTIFCGLLYGFQKRGLAVEAFKCGPDYIDPMFHQKVLGIPSGNLDLFLSGEDSVRHLLKIREKDGGVSLIEGAMGYYDGIGMTEKGSCYELACLTKTPVVLVCDASRTGASILAVLQGFLEYREQSMIEGVIFNRITKERYEQILPLVKGFSLRPLGYVPKCRDFVLESRHLGLIRADEIEDFHQKLQCFYEIVKDTLDWDGLLEVGRNAGSL